MPTSTMTKEECEQLQIENISGLALMVEEHGFQFRMRPTPIDDHGSIVFAADRNVTCEGPLVELVQFLRGWAWHKRLVKQLMVSY